MEGLGEVFTCLRIVASFSIVTLWHCHFVTFLHCFYIFEKIGKASFSIVTGHWSTKWIWLSLLWDCENVFNIWLKIQIWYFGMLLAVVAFKGFWGIFITMPAQGSRHIHHINVVKICCHVYDTYMYFWGTLYIHTNLTIFITMPALCTTPYQLECTYQLSGYRSGGFSFQKVKHVQFIIYRQIWY